MAKLAVCGDSFSAVSKILPGTHYSELLAEKLGWELLNYARRGCSNGGIRLQIDEAIRQQADYVIVVPTSWDRMEIPASGVPYAYDKPPRIWGNPLQDHLLNAEQYQGYDPKIGIKNINYSITEPSTMIFETIFTLAENHDHEYRAGLLSRDTTRAVKDYINHIYDSNWKRQCDIWIMVSGVAALHDSKIPFSIEPGMLWDHYPPDHFLSDIPKFVDPRYVRSDNTKHVGHGVWLHPLVDVEKDPGYHGALESQQYIANFFYEIIQELGLCN